MELLIIDTLSNYLFSEDFYNSDFEPEEEENITEIKETDKVILFNPDR